MYHPPITLCIRNAGDDVDAAVAAAAVASAAVAGDYDDEAAAMAASYHVVAGDVGPVCRFWHFSWSNRCKDASQSAFQNLFYAGFLPEYISGG